MRDGLRPQAKVFVFITTLLGAGCFYWAYHTMAEFVVLEALLLGGCALVADLYPIQLYRNGSEGGVVSVAAALDFAAVLLLPPQVAIIVVALTGGVSDLVSRNSPVKALFNTAQLAVATAAAGFVYHLGPGGPFMIRTHILWGIASGLSFLLVNSVFTCTIIAFAQGVRPLNVWRAANRDMIVHDLALYPIGMLFAIVYQQDMLAIILFVLPLFVIFTSLRSYVALSQETRQVLETLADIVDRRDPYTFKHSKRVADYAVVIAESMGLSDQEIGLIHSAARVHDLGKLTWSDSILLKPDKLTPQEFEMVRDHPTIGARVLSSLLNYKNGVPLIRHHHERIDGKGYPDGLMADRIPLGARILAVADSYDAMTSDRPYRKALPQDEAIRRLIEGSGTQFDPDVVQVFVNWIAHHKKMAPRVDNPGTGDGPEEVA